jgi:hypothetical protein
MLTVIIFIEKKEDLSVVIDKIGAEIHGLF